jgi:type I restriction enzyme R subunit
MRIPRCSCARHSDTKDTSPEAGTVDNGEAWVTKPEIRLTKAEEREVKKVAKQLLETLKEEKLVLDWKKRQSTRAAVRYTIETVLDELPRTFTPDLYQQKCELVYQHVFDSYSGQGKSLYASSDLIL